MRRILYFVVFLMLSNIILTKVVYAEKKEVIVPETVIVRGGIFTMGSNEGYSPNKPAHKVFVDSFFISKYEITNKQFVEFLNDYLSLMDKFSEKLINTKGNKIYRQNGKWICKKSYENYPVTRVTWYGANYYCLWLSLKIANKYRLPTEAEWEYAAKGGVSADCFWKDLTDDNIDNFCWYEYNSGKHPHPIGQKKSNQFDIYDIFGNVMEWCSDWYDKDYYKKCKDNEPIKNPKGLLLDSNDYFGYDKVKRGGSFEYTMGSLVCYRRFKDEPDTDDPYNDTGFRIVLELPIDESMIDINIRGRRIKDSDYKFNINDKLVIEIINFKYTSNNKAIIIANIKKENENKIKYSGKVRITCELISSEWYIIELMNLNYKKLN